MTKNIASLKQMLRRCRMCPRACGVDRTAGEKGACGIGTEAVVASDGAHWGEEPVLVGNRGSGTIFLSGCNLHCVFCQNFDISHNDRGLKVTPDELAQVAMSLQSDGCANVNFVTPTHLAHAVAEAIHIARRQGLEVPVVYNCGGYESTETLGLLEGLVEIYMPDFKYADPDAGKKYCGVDDYPSVATVALARMYRQVGPLVVGEDGLAERGLLVRHLVMPSDAADSRRVIDIVSENAPTCAINVMGQWRPAYRAGEFAELTQPVSRQTVNSLRHYATQRGLVRVDH